MQKFNLITEPWIPVIDSAPVSLKEIFTNTNLKMLGGTPPQKISVLKLLCAISQASYTPATEKDWESDDLNTVSNRIVKYLEDHFDSFWLYSDKPFLQMPVIKTIKTKKEKKVYPVTVLDPSISSGNTTVLFESNSVKDIDDAQKVLLIITSQIFSFGGKTPDQNIVLSENYVKKSSKPGVALGTNGFLHSFFISESILQTVWVNTLSHEKIEESKLFPKGIGIAPWEKMPSGENDQVAVDLMKSYMGQLVPLGRFIYLEDNRIYYTEGIKYPELKEGYINLSTTIKEGKNPKAIWTNPDKKPWRELTSILSFLTTVQDNKDPFTCRLLKMTYKRLKEDVCLWTGGVRVKSNAGEQYVSGDADYLESNIKLSETYFSEFWYKFYTNELEKLSYLSKIVYGSVAGYFSTLNMNGKAHASKACNLFWQLCDKQKNELLKACDSDDDELEIMKKKFSAIVHDVYNNICPRNTARQIDAWSKNKPVLYKYMKGDANEQS